MATTGNREGWQEDPRQSCYYFTQGITVASVRAASRHQMGSGKAVLPRRKLKFLDHHWWLFLDKGLPP